MTRDLRILCIFGTRPEAIKLAPIVRELRRRSAAPTQGPAIQTRVCVTAQHREMLDEVLRLFEIVPDHDLDVMVADQTPGRVAAGVLGKLERVLEDERPDWVILQGDTTSVAAAALAAYYSRIRVGHVEAGLRTHDKWRPFPEEINRRVAGVIADLHFAPTERGRQNLLQEGIPENRIVVTGNTVIDAVHWVSSLPCDESGWGGELAAPSGSAPRLILVTAHRRESFGRALEEICRALREIATRYGDGVRIVYPVHPNPRVQGPVCRLLGDVANIRLLPPLGYLQLVHLMKRAHFVMTDSGGIQEEAPGLGKPVLVLRELTERPEAVEAGAARLVGTRCGDIVAEATRLLEEPGAYERMARVVNLYGDGRAAERIVDLLVRQPGGEPPIS